MKEVGQVVLLEDSIATVRFERSSACKDCGACMMSESQKEMLLKVSNTLNAKENEWVKVELESPMLIKASLITYIFPLFLLIIGAAVGYFLNEAIGIMAESQTMAAIMALVFVALSFVIIHMLESKFKKNKGFSPQMVQIVDEPIKVEQ